MTQVIVLRWQHVRTVGSDANSGTSPEDAFRTIRAAAMYAPAGSIVYVGAGVYTDNATLLDLNASIAMPTRIIADTSGVRTGDAGDAVIGPGGSVEVLSCSNVRISGFTFQGPTDRCFVWRQSTGGTVEDCTFVEGTSAVKIRSGEVMFQDCVVRDFAGDGIEVFGTAELFLLDCKVNDCAASGLEINEYARVTIDGSTFDGNSTNGLTVDAITSPDDALIAGSPLQMLQDARALLNAAHGLATDEGNDKIEDAIEKLDEALWAEYWSDAWHPAVDDGKKIFEKDKEAMDKLKDFLKNDPDKDAELGNYGIVKTNVPAANALMLLANGKLAMIALQEAIVGDGDSSKIEDAYKELKKVQKELDKGHPHHAAGKYKKVREKAIDAGGSAEGSLGIGTDNDNPPDALANRALTISGSTFSTNQYGIRVLTSQTFAMRFSGLLDNTQWGLYLPEGVVVEDCTINGNAIGGVWLKDVEDVDLDVERLTFTDNVQYGLYAEACDLSFSTSNIGDWVISGSEYGITATGGTLALDGVTVSGGSTSSVLVDQGTLTANNTSISGLGVLDGTNATLAVCTFSGATYGLYADDSTVTAEQCTISNNAVGLYLNQNASVTIRDTTIHTNSQWGTALYASASPGATATFDNCTIRDNVGGMVVYDAEDGDLVLTDTTIRDNTDSGLHIEKCTLTLMDQSSSNWQLLRNKIGISSDQSTLTLTDVTIEDSTSFGVVCEASNVTLTGCVVSGQSGIYADAANNDLTVKTSKFEETSGASGGWGLIRLGGDVTVSDCLFVGFDNGISLDTASTLDQATVANAKVVDATAYGIKLVGGDATVNNTIICGNSAQYGLSQQAGLLTHTHNLIYGFSTPFDGISADATEL